MWFDAVVLAGGRASRLGGADKPALVVGKRSLLASVVSAAAGAGARRVIVVGPDRPGLRAAAPDLRVVREEPPASGPVPALRRGLAEVSAPWVVLLGADLPFLEPADLAGLLAAARGFEPAAGAAEPAAGAAEPAAGAVLAEPAAGAVLADEAGRPQWVVSCWPSAMLRAATGRYQGGSLHGLLRPLSPVILPPRPDRAGPPPWLDCDTEDDVRLARAWSGTRRPDRARRAAMNAEGVQ